MTNPTRYLTVKQVADMTQYSPWFIYEALNRGVLKGTKSSEGFRAHWRIRPEDVDAWLERNAA